MPMCGAERGLLRAPSLSYFESKQMIFSVPITGQASKERSRQQKAELKKTYFFIRQM